MCTAGVDYQFIAYSRAMHDFTNPNASDDPSKVRLTMSLLIDDPGNIMKMFIAELFE